MRRHLIGLLMLMVAVQGCDSPSTPEESSPPSPEVRRYELQVAGYPFRVELADTVDLRRLGLSGREELGADEGMLFVSRVPEIMAMWMKDCQIPLDVLFFDENRRLINYHTMALPAPGQPDNTLPRYPSDKPAKYALELAAGTAGRYGLSKADEITLSGELLKAIGRGTE